MLMKQIYLMFYKSNRNLVNLQIPVGKQQRLIWKFYTIWNAATLFSIYKILQNAWPDDRLWEYLFGNLLFCPVTIRYASRNMETTYNYINKHNNMISLYVYIFGLNWLFSLALDYIKFSVVTKFSCN